MNWDFIKDRQEIEFQTLNPTTSRTVWLGVVEGRLFLVSGYMNTGYGGLWKQWPHYLAEDDRIILRIDGMLYEQRLERIMGGEIVAPVLSEFGRKYGIRRSQRRFSGDQRRCVDVRSAASLTPQHSLLLADPVRNVYTRRPVIDRPFGTLFERRNYAGN